MKIGLQTYTIRNELARDMDQALARIKEMGITYLELARVQFSQSTLDLLKKHDLRVIAIQATYHMLKHEARHIQTFMKQVNCQIACVSVISFGAIFGAKRAIKKYAMKLNQLAKTYQDAGLILAFHHHDHEFRQIDGKPKLAWLMDMTDPAVKYVLDTYWVTKMKEDPLDWIDRLKDRLIGLHLRDHDWSGHHQSIDTELGQGTIDFSKIIHHVASTAIYGAIEQNTRTPYQSIRKSVEHLHHLGIDCGKEEI